MFSPVVSVIVAVAIFLGLPLAEAAPVKPESVLHPFTSDGCSMWPDGWPGIKEDQWRHCCVLHDFRYYMGGTMKERMAADVELGQCVGKSGKSFANDVMGIVIDAGVIVGGQPFFPTTWRWGYGWKYDRGYSPLTQEERALAEAMLPDRKKAFGYKPDAKEGYKLRPWESKDRCKDTVRFAYKKTTNFEPLKITKSTLVANRYTVVSAACIGATHFDLEATSCTRTDDNPIRIRQVSTTGICVVPEKFRK